MSHVTCECGAMLIEYERQRLDDDYLVMFQHSGEQSLSCDGYFQCQMSEFDKYGVETEEEDREIDP